MHYRRLGTTESEVSEVGFGAWGIGGGQQWQGGDDQQAMRALKRSFELGVNFVDTALAYGDGHSEQMVGQALRDCFHSIWVATKIPPKNRTWPASPSTPISEVFPYDYTIRCTEESLRNLGVEQIYLQQFHVWTDAWINADEWKRAVEDLRNSGKVRFFGISVSEHDPDSALLAVETGLFNSVQVIYNIFDQSAEQKLFPLCQAMKVGVLARVPLDEGGLTGNITEETEFAPDDFRASYFRGDRKRQLVEHLNALKQDLRDVPGTLPQIAIRFCLSHPAVTSVIPGMRRIATVEDNSRAAAAGMLDQRTLAILKRHAWDRNWYD